MNEIVEMIIPCAADTDGRLYPIGGGCYPELIRCKDCECYDERIAICDNCGLPREQTFFCADGKRRTDNA